jgi:hypothetical protein
MKINVELEFDIDKLYQMTENEFIEWYNNLNLMEKIKYNLFVLINENNGEEVKYLEEFNGYYRVTPKVELIPYELEDYKKIAGEKIDVSKDYYVPCREIEHDCIIVDVNRKTNKVIVYIEFYKQLKSYTLCKMHDLFTRLDGTKFEKEAE